MSAIVELAYDSMSPKVQPSFPSSKDIYDNRDPSFLQPVSMEIHSGVIFTEGQIGLYKEERAKPLVGGQVKSDQVLMAEVLEQTGGPAGFFREAYPNIFPPTIKES